MLLIRLELIWVLFLSRNQYIHTGNAATWMGRDKLDWVWGKKKPFTVGLCSVIFISANNFLSGQYRIAGSIHPSQKNPSIYREVDLHHTLRSVSCQLNSLCSLSMLQKSHLQGISNQNSLNFGSLVKILRIQRQEVMRGNEVSRRL